MLIMIWRGIVGVVAALFFGAAQAQMVLPGGGSGGSGIPSIAGTPNQINQSGSPGATTLSLPPNLTIGSTYVLNFIDVSLTAPAAPGVTTSGTGGSATWQYALSALNANGNTVMGPRTLINTGNSTLSSSNFNVITTSAVANATSCNVYRTFNGGTPSTFGLIGNIPCGGTLNDTGLAANNVFPDLYDTTGGLLTHGRIQIVATGPSIDYMFIIKGSAGGGADAGILLQNGPTTGAPLIDFKDPATGSARIGRNSIGQAALFTGGVGGSVNSSFQIGSIDATPVQLFTSNLGRVLLDSAGNFGIGTLTPAYMLTVAGTSGFAVGPIMTGSPPTLSGTCTHGTQTGGNAAGTIVLTCTAQTVILTFAATAPTGWSCNAHDLTTPADVMNQTAASTTTATLTGTTAASDIVAFNCVAY